MALLKSYLLVFISLIAAVTATDEEAQQREALSASQQPAHAVDSSDDFRDSLQSKAFLGSYRTITRTGVSLFTSTVLATCLSGFQTSTVCAGRKKRGITSRIEPRPILGTALSHDQYSSPLDSSQSEETETEATDKEGRGRLVGGVYTIWNTATTSTTVTTLYTNSATTISLSYYCTVRNMDLPLVFC